MKVSSDQDIATKRYARLPTACTLFVEIAGLWLSLLEYRLGLPNISPVYQVEYEMLKSPVTSFRLSISFLRTRHIQGPLRRPG